MTESRSNSSNEPDIIFFNEMGQVLLSFKKLLDVLVKEELDKDKREIVENLTKNNAFLRDVILDNYKIKKGQDPDEKYESLLKIIILKQINKIQLNKNDIVLANKIRLGPLAYPLGQIQKPYFIHMLLQMMQATTFFSRENIEDKNNIEGESIEDYRTDFLAFICNNLMSFINISSVLENDFFRLILFSACLECMSYADDSAEEEIFTEFMTWEKVHQVEHYKSIQLAEILLVSNFQDTHFIQEQLKAWGFKVIDEGVDIENTVEESDSEILDPDLKFAISLSLEQLEHIVPNINSVNSAQESGKPKRARSPSPSNFFEENAKKMRIEDSSDGDNKHLMALKMLGNKRP